MDLHTYAMNTIKLNYELATSTKKKTTYVKRCCKVLLEEYLCKF